MNAFAAAAAETAYVAVVAVAANVDNLGAGFAYALSKRHIAPGPNLIIAAFSSVLALLGVLAGSALSRHLSAVAPSTISGATFLALGVWAIVDLLRTPQRVEPIPVGGIELFVLAFGLSINAGAAGVAAGFGGHSPIALALAVGIASAAAIELGRRFGSRIWRGPTRRISQALGALAFLTIGVVEFIPYKAIAQTTTPVAAPALDAASHEHATTLLPRRTS
jgi:putative Mn2+ efflux pump MntP